MIQNEFCRRLKKKEEEKTDIFVLIKTLNHVRPVYVAIDNGMKKERLGCVSIRKNLAK